MLTLKDVEGAQPIAIIDSGRYKGEIIYIDRRETSSTAGKRDISLGQNKLTPILDPNNRQVCYVAGPSGSGKSTYVATLARGYHKVYPKRPMYIFSRTTGKDDPAFKRLKLIQVQLDESLVTNPIDISELEYGSLIIFDDTTTISDVQIRKAVDHLINDIMEVGRRMGLWIIVTNHLVNPNERKLGRTIMNEFQTITVFPKSGSASQIRYALEHYVGMTKKAVDKLFEIPNTRWVTVMRNYPQAVLYENGVYLL